MRSLNQGSEDQQVVMADESSFEGAGASFQSAYTDVAAAGSGDPEFVSSKAKGAKTELQAVSEQIASTLEDVVAALRAEELPSLAPAIESELVADTFEMEAPAGETVAAENGISSPKDTPPLSGESDPRNRGGEGGPHCQQSLRLGSGGPGRQVCGVAEATGTSLEGSVKAMLRPLVRRWLVENLSGVVQAKLRDELTQANAFPPRSHLRVKRDYGRDGVGLDDYGELARNMERRFDEGTQAVRTLARRDDGAGPYSMVSEAGEAGKALDEITHNWVRDSGKLVAAQGELFKGYAEFWGRSLQRFLGEQGDSMMKPESDDNRFKAPEQSNS